MGTVGIIGAGTMGAGIAQVAAGHGWTVRLVDLDADIARAAIGGVGKRFDRNVEKGRMTADECAAAKSRLHACTDRHDLSDCDLLLEAIVENLEIKLRVLGELVPVLRADAIIATNTSSLSVTQIGRGLTEAHRTVGMHFFNPAPLMKLVEVIAGDDTDPAVVERVATIAGHWGKTVAHAADVPGFIVNHVARPYYLESFRILEDGQASVADIDEAMKSMGGFRMGPFQLTDLIGQDVNTATTRSVWDQLGRPPLLHPSRLQESLVDAGHLGRKSGRGVYDYSGDTPSPALDPGTDRLSIPDRLTDLCREFAARGAATPGDDRASYVFARVLTALMVQAAHALDRGVATASDIDNALRYGVNYPDGPFAWRSRIGAELCDEVAAALNATVDDDRFAPPAEAATP